MLAWVAGGGQFPKRAYDGTLGSLADLFSIDEDSPYQACKWNTQHLYDDGIKVIKDSCGARRPCLDGTGFQQVVPSMGIAESHRHGPAPSPGKAYDGSGPPIIG